MLARDSIVRVWRVRCRTVIRNGVVGDERVVIERCRCNISRRIQDQLAVIFRPPIVLVIILHAAGRFVRPVVQRVRRILQPQEAELLVYRIKQIAIKKDLPFWSLQRPQSATSKVFHLGKSKAQYPRERAVDICRLSDGGVRRVHLAVNWEVVVLYFRVGVGAVL